MQLWNLGNQEIEELRNLPETGMGFQFLEATIWGETKPLLILNSELAFDLSQIDLEPGDEPAVILRNGLRIISELKSQPVVTTFSVPKPHSFTLLESRVGSLPAPPRSGATRPIVSSLPSSLVKRVILAGDRLFYRYSAFNPDRRVNSSGDFLPGTYGAPESEVAFVPTGFLAVGRFALPNILPASFRYEITAPVGTCVDFGTVAPAYGQAGGGVEAYFAKGAKNRKSPATAVQKLPDE